jgi:periplasmic mercuric ion binding protein
MKTLKITTFYIIILVLFITFSANVQAQTKNKTSNIQSIQIKTSAVCDMCKETIEKALSYESGVKKSNLDVKTKICTVQYDINKTTPEKIRLAISKSGYDADEVKADKKAYDKLSPCCKAGNSIH